MIILYQYETCPFCQKVRRYFDANNIEYKKVEVDPFNKPKEVTESSERGTVPVIKDGDVVMAHSDDIIEYVKKKYVEKA